jgi:hypothetical protein
MKPIIGWSYEYGVTRKSGAVLEDLAGTVPGRHPRGARLWRREATGRVAVPLQPPGSGSLSNSFAK